MDPDFTQTPKRTQEQLRHHFEVERELAAKLRASDREGRTDLFAKLYGELFERVPDHPRFTRQGSEEKRRRSVANQMKLVNAVLPKGGVLVEFAPGDCWLSCEAAKTASEVIAIDISDQRDPSQTVPKNLRHVVYDGYGIDLPGGIADTVFSYQFLEHLHPDDVRAHFQQALRLLKPGGSYVFDTPHLFSGPHDISRYFTDELVCFHFQEWTHRQMRAGLLSYGFESAQVFRRGRIQHGWLSDATFALEAVLEPLSHRLRRRIFGRLFPSVAMVARKGVAASNAS